MAASNSATSLASSYKVPSLDGRMLEAIPLKLCLKFRPPTIAVVYKMGDASRTILSSKSTRREKRYVHEIFVE